MVKKISTVQLVHASELVMEKLKAERKNRGQLEQKLGRIGGEPYIKMRIKSSNTMAMAPEKGYIIEMSLKPEFVLQDARNMIAEELQVETSTVRLYSIDSGELSYNDPLIRQSRITVPNHAAIRRGRDSVEVRVHSTAFHAHVMPGRLRRAVDELSFRGCDVDWHDFIGRHFYDENKAWNISVNTINGDEVLSVNVDPDRTTVRKLRADAARVLEISSVQLVLEDQALEDGHTLADAGLSDGSVLFCINRDGEKAVVDVDGLHMSWPAPPASYINDVYHSVGDYLS